MADDKALVALLKEFACEASITRPEVGKLVGKTLGQIAGVHNRNKKTIGTWPEIDPTRKKNRRCQFPLGTPGTDSFHLCGKDRAPGNTLVCAGHSRMTWKPPKER